MSETLRVDVLVEAIRAYCEAQQIASLSLLGGAFDDWLRPNTEVGLLVDYLPGASITYIDMARQERELGKIIGGAIDLRTPNELEMTTRQTILKGATLVFVQNSRE